MEIETMDKSTHPTEANVIEERPQAVQVTDTRRTTKARAKLLIRTALQVGYSEGNGTLYP